MEDVSEIRGAQAVYAYLLHCLSEPGARRRSYSVAPAHAQGTQTAASSSGYHAGRARGRLHREVGAGRAFSTSSERIFLETSERHRP